MSLDKAINSGKEKRKKYTGSKAIDKSCRNHGTCKYCEENRLYKFKKKEPIEDEEYDYLFDMYIDEFDDLEVEEDDER